MPSMEARSNNRMLMKNYFFQSAVKLVFGRQSLTLEESAAVARASHGSRGPTSVIGNCCVCRDQKRKQRKTI